MGRILDAMNERLLDDFTFEGLYLFVRTVFSFSEVMEHSEWMCVVDKKHYFPMFLDLCDGRHGAQEKSQIQGFGPSPYAQIEIKREKWKLIIVIYIRYSQYMIRYQHIHKLEWHPQEPLQEREFFQGYLKGLFGVPRYLP